MPFGLRAGSLAVSLVGVGMEQWIIGQHDAATVLAQVDRLHQLHGGRLIVCFDYFDTLVTRTVYPEYTKVLASTLLSRSLALDVDGETLYTLRRDLERQITKRNAEQTGELDFRLDRFAEAFLPVIRQHYSGGGELSPPAFTKLVIDIEVAVEKAVQQLCPQVVHLVEQLRRKGISLVLASDFYLPGDAFGQLIEYHGIAGHFSEVFISADHGKTKGSGTLYTELVHRLQRRPEEILMIGDNPHADIKMAREAGLPTIQLSRPAQQQCYTRWRREAEDKTASTSHAFSGLTLPALVFPEMGISLWLFVHRLFNALRKQGASDVFFLSKEGEYLQKLFCVYQRQLFNRVLIRPHYLLASRKSTFIASLRPLDDEDFHRLFDHYRDISIREFLLSLNLDEQLVATIIAELDINGDRRLQKTVEHTDFKALLRLPRFRQTYEHLRREQAENLQAYLDSFGVDFRDKGLFLVDVGWKGSIQDNIFHALAGKTTIHGYYIGSLNATERHERNLKTGLLFDNYPEDSPFLAVYNSNRSLFEMILGASHGSADCYRLKSGEDGAGTAASGLMVYETRETKHGMLQVMVKDVPEERELFSSTIKPIQEQLYQLFCAMTRRYLRAQCRLPDNRWFARQHARMVFLPTAAEITFFERLYHLENFGIFEFTRFTTDHSFSLLARLINLKNIIKHPGVLESGIWPPIILRRFGVGFWQRVDGRRRYVRTFGSLPKRSGRTATGSSEQTPPTKSVQMKR